MKMYPFVFWAVSGFAVTWATVFAQDAASSRPHVPRPGKNLVVNPSVRKKAKNWTLLRDAQFDAKVSRKKDGSGSFRLVTPIPDGSMVLSDLIPVKCGQTYTYGFYVKTLNGPTYVGAQISIHDRSRKYLRNLAATCGGTTQDGEWQEFALPFVVPPGVEFIGLQVYKTENTKPGGEVWVDDFYLGEGLGLEQPPSPKQAFDGAHVRVDALGNFEINKHGNWTPFFPLCMFSDNLRDLSVYSRQGWNTIMWTSEARQIELAKDAVSDFNPEGMMAGFQIAQYTFPSGWAYHNMDDLRTQLRAIFDRQLDEHLLLYYWDNECHHDQWQVPNEVINTIKSLDVDSSGKRLRPVYALQGMFNLARVHAAKGLVDVSGMYLGNTPSDHENLLFILDRQEKQTSPAAFAQFNDVNDPGDMRMRLYQAIILGAKAIGYWRDCFSPDQRKEFPSVGPVDQKAWWPDFPHLRREVDRLLPIIREPHWTEWKVKINPSDNVFWGTRNHRGEGYLFLVNKTDAPQTIEVKLAGLPYAASEVADFFDGKKVAKIRNSSFSVTLPELGIDRGTKVFHLVPLRVNR